MNLESLSRKVLAQGLPTLGGALGGPAGAVVAATVAHHLGVEPTPGSIARAVVNDPGAMAELRRIEADMAAQSDKHDEAMASLEVQDRQNARANRSDDRMRFILGIVLPIVALLFGSALCGMLFWAKEVTQAVGIGGTILGWLIRDASAATSFFFGTSVGSARRAAELAKVRNGS